jgi:putative ATP-binding cassette transporter
MIPEPENVEEARRELGLEPPQPAESRLKHAWRLTARYFVSSDWKAAWALLICYIALETGVVYLMLWLNNWNRSFYDAVEQRHSNLFLGLVAMFAAIAFAQVGISQLSTSVSWTLSIRWRNWMTDWYLGRWFARDRFYQIERLRLIDNPDQRIAEDINSFTSLSGSANGTCPITAVVALFTSLLTAITFASIILSVSGTISFGLFGSHVAIEGDLVWYSILWVLFGSFVIAKLGRPYIRRRMRQQHFEGDFRAGLIHVRRNAEQIAFTGTHRLEDLSLREAFANIRRNWFALMWANIGLNTGVGSYQRVTAIVPLFFTVPRFFAGKISFGQVMAAQSAFSTFTVALSYFIEAYPGIASQVANVNRLKALDDAIDYSRSRGIAFFAGGTPPGTAIENRELSLRRPNGAPLLDVGNWTVSDGQRWIIEGPSGAGKTTLLRAIAGLWPDGTGEVRMTNRARVMLVPQRLYIPLGTLKNAVCFPDTDEQYDDATIIALLHKVRLSAQVEHLHNVRYWQEELSPGEQQRVALARTLLHQPELLVLDEATSALDPENAQFFYETLLAEIPKLTLVSVVHNEKLARFHTDRLCIADGRARQAAIDVVVPAPATT